VEENKVVHKAQDLESDEFLLLKRLNRLCVYIDFGWFLSQRIL
jgi:SHS2 domain-containing protein